MHSYTEVWRNEKRHQIEMPNKENDSVWKFSDSEETVDWIDVLSRRWTGLTRTSMSLWQSRRQDAGDRTIMRRVTVHNADTSWGQCEMSPADGWGKAELYYTDRLNRARNEPPNVEPSTCTCTHACCVHAPLRVGDCKVGSCVRDFMNVRACVCARVSLRSLCRYLFCIHAGTRMRRHAWVIVRLVHHACVHSVFKL